MILTGVIINVAAIIIGSAAGLLLKKEFRTAWEILL